MHTKLAIEDLAAPIAPPLRLPDVLLARWYSHGMVAGTDETEFLPVRDCDLDIGNSAAFRRNCVLRGGSWLHSKSQPGLATISDADIAACMKQAVQECRALVTPKAAEVEVVRAVGQPAPPVCVSSLSESSRLISTVFGPRVALPAQPEAS